MENKKLKNYIPDSADAKANGDVIHSDDPASLIIFGTPGEAWDEDRAALELRLNEGFDELKKLFKHNKSLSSSMKLYTLIGKLCRERHNHTIFHTYLLYARETKLSYPTVLKTVNLLAKLNIIKISQYPGVKGKGRGIHVTRFREWNWAKIYSFYNIKEKPGSG